MFFTTVKDDIDSQDDQMMIAEMIMIEMMIIEIIKC